MIEPVPSQRDLFQAALALPGALRGSWLTAHCPDAAQPDVIERMLTADARADEQMLAHSFDNLLDDIGNAEADGPWLDSHIGHFSLIERLGEGGSSIVFRAEREQAAVKQLVALKLLRRGLHTSEEPRRFRDERRALTQLRHPGIARLIEGGLIDTGMLYMARELVDGEPITHHARNRLQRLLNVQLAQKQPNPRAIAMLRLPLGRAPCKLDRPDLARENTRTHLQPPGNPVGQHNSHNREPLSLLSRSLAATGEHDAALSAAREAAEIADASFARGNSARIRIALLLSDLLRSTRAQAADSYRTRIGEAAAAPARPLDLLVEAHNDLADLASASGNDAEAAHEWEIVL